MDEFGRTREQMKEFVNKMLKSLAEEAKMMGGDRNAFRGITASVCRR